MGEIFATLEIIKIQSNYSNRYRINTQTISSESQTTNNIQMMKVSSHPIYFFDVSNLVIPLKSSLVVINFFGIGQLEF